MLLPFPTREKGRWSHTGSLHFIPTLLFHSSNLTSKTWQNRFLEEKLGMACFNQTSEDIPNILISNQASAEEWISNQLKQDVEPEIHTSIYENLICDKDDISTQWVKTGSLVCLGYLFSSAGIGTQGLCILNKLSTTKLPWQSCRYKRIENQVDCICQNNFRGLKMYRNKTIGSVVNDALSKCQALKRHTPMSILV